MARSILFYFPWREASGGPVYLTTIARELSKTYPGTIYYTDYENGLSDSMLEGSSVKKITVHQNDFSVNITEPVVFVTPLYWAHWMPVIHPESTILFIDWHNLCLPVLRDSWKIDPKRLKVFLQIISESHSVMFCDAAHREALNSYGIDFDPTYVPIGVEAATIAKTDYKINQKHLKIAILGRLSIDKVFAVTNLAKHFEEFDFLGKKTLYVIGSGPEQHRIIPENYPSVEIIFTGPLFDEKLNDFLVENVDVMFAMGTSALMSASLGIPTVIVCHEVHEYPDNTFVFLDQVKGYCLGWQCEQVKTLQLPALTLKEVLSPMLNPTIARQVAQRGIKYVHEKHSPAFAAKKFLKAVQMTSLTWEKADNTFRSWTMSRRRLLSFGNKHVLWYGRSKNNIHEFYYGDRLLICGRNEGVWKFLYRLFLKANRIRCSVKHNIARTKIFIGDILRSDRRVLANLAQIDRKQHAVSEKLNNDIQNLANQFDEQKKLIEHLTQTNASLIWTISEHLSKQSDALPPLFSRYGGQGLCASHLPEKNTNEQSKVPDTRFAAPCNKISDVPIDSFEQKIVSQSALLSTEQTEKLFSDRVSRKYLPFVQGMDSKSQIVVTRALMQLWHCAARPKYDIQITWDEEQKYKKNLDLQQREISQMEDGWYLYNGKYYLPCIDSVFEDLYCKCFVPSLTHPEMLHAKSVIDVGASVGTSLLAMREFTDKDIWAIEPNRHNFIVLNQMIERNNLKNIRPLRMIVGAKSIIMGRNKRNAQPSRTNSLVDASLSSKREITLLQTIDGLVQRYKIDTGLIKIGADSNVLQVLFGSRETIVTQKPVLLISTNDNFEQFFQAKKWLQSLNLDYTFKVRKPDNVSATMGVCLICEAL